MYNTEDKPKYIKANSSTITNLTKISENEFTSSSWDINIRI